MPAMSSQAHSPRQQSAAKVASSPGPHSEEARSFMHDFPISPGTFLTLSLTQLQTQGLTELSIQLICMKQEAWGWRLCCKGSSQVSTTAWLCRFAALALPCQPASHGASASKDSLERRPSRCKRD